MEYKIDKDNLQRLLNSKCRSITGRVLRRIETIKDEKTLKTVVMDTIGEEFRDLAENINAFHNGLIFSLKRKDSIKE